MNKDINILRQEFMEKGLARIDLNLNPIDQFQAWYQLICELEILEPNAMTLCTVGPAQQPSARTVLLKFYDQKGFVFFTNYSSQKSQEITQNQHVALLFPWVALARQVQIQGDAERISALESLSYFATRPRGSQIGAWSSPQSQVITSRAFLESKVAAMTSKFAQGEIPLPDFWGGYRVIPRMIEFWQGRANRLHDRFRYLKINVNDQSWQIERLAP